jgi:integrase
MGMMTMVLSPPLDHSPRWNGAAVATVRRGRPRGDSGLVFAREDGSPLDPDTFSKSFKGHVRAAGLPEIRVHDLRHTWASLALKAGVPLKVVSEILGHSSISITADIYQHTTPSMFEEATRAVAALIEG